jgi:hypothetical protein
MGADPQAAAHGWDTGRLRQVLTEIPGDGIYNFSAVLFIPAQTDVVSIGFETPIQQFMHIDFR